MSVLAHILTVHQTTNCDRVTQHNFIETLEATSIYKEANRSSNNVKIIFLGTKMTENELRKSINSQGLDQLWQVRFSTKK